MTVYERIKYLREKSNMSQSDLAEKVGYKSKAAISKVEKGLRDISQAMLVRYAIALGTTPAYLMGWTEEENPSAAEPKLSEGEEMLLDLFRRIPEEQQKMVLDMIRAALNTLQ